MSLRLCLFFKCDIGSARRIGSRNEKKKYREDSIGNAVKIEGRHLSYLGKGGVYKSGGSGKGSATGDDRNLRGVLGYCWGKGKALIVKGGLARVQQE